MGFSHDVTAHHFHLLKDGGEIVVTANDATDKASVEQIRVHLNHIVTKREFQRPNADSRHQPAGRGYNDSFEVQHPVHRL